LRGQERWKRLFESGCVALASVPLFVTGAGASVALTQGISSTAIHIGLPYPDFSSLEADGLNIDQGSFPNAFNALIANLNAQGGINGRKVVPSTAQVEPASAASSQSACTSLTEDDKVFVAFGPLYPLCYQKAGVATLNGVIGATLSPSAAPNFTLTPPSAAFDPLQLSVFSKLGIFKKKKVGVIASSVDQAELTIVKASLRHLNVNVVQTAVDSAFPTDVVASNQQVQVIAQKFKNAGVTVVVGVGTGSTAWLLGLNDTQSAYAPRLVATNNATFVGTADTKGEDNPIYLKGAVTASPFPSQKVFFNDPAIQKCINIIKKAYPSTVIGNPIGAPTTAPTTWVAPENSCQDLALFTAITKAAGRNLTARTFKEAGYSLRNISIPGMGAPVSFGPGRAYALGPIYLVTYSTKLQQFVTSSKPVTPK
jgi:Periplasmic binding protein